VLQKLDLAQWLVTSHSPLVAKNPAGYLRKAIEEDYTPPKRYTSKAQRRADTEQRAQALTAAQEQRHAAEADVTRAKAVQQERIAKRYPPVPIALSPLTTETAWQQTLAALREQMTTANFQMWLMHTVLASCPTDTATIVVPSTFHRDFLQQRLNPVVTEALATVLGRPVRCTYLALPELLPTGDHAATDPTPAPPRLEDRS